MNFSWAEGVTAARDSFDNGCTLIEANSNKLRTTSKKFTWRQRRLTLLLFPLWLCFHGQICASSQVSTPNSTFDEGDRSNLLPSGAICLLKQPLLPAPTADRGSSNTSADARQQAGLVRPSKSADFFDSLVQLSENSIQFKSNNQQQPSRAAALSQHQLAFQTICAGWHNNQLSANLVRPRAYWAFDERRAILVAKFIFYDRNDFIDISREARLTSPTFPPLPDEGSCKLSYSVYMTIPAYLELSLIHLEPNRHPTSLAPSIQYLDVFYSGSLPEGKLLADRAGESAAWTTRQVLISAQNTSTNVTYTGQKLHYVLQFSATPGPITSASMRRYSYLTGVAIANISLSPQCFGLGPDPEKSPRTKSIAGQATFGSKSSTQQAAVATMTTITTNRTSSRTTDALPTVETYKSSSVFLILFISMLVLVVFVSQYLLCASHRAYHHNQKGAGFNLTSFAQMCCPGGSKSSRQHRTSQFRANKFTIVSQIEMRNHLQPLKAAAFDNVQFTENPNYVLSVGETACLKLSSTMSELPLDRCSIDRKQLTITSQLGKGAFGEVYRGNLSQYNRSASSLARNDQTTSNESQPERKAVAVKTLTDERMSSTDFVREALSMSMVKHRNIVQLIGVCFEQEPLYIVMELLQGGNLKNFLIKNRDKVFQQQPRQQLETISSLCMGDLLVFALDIARACDYLQKNQFIHRDLAARNCLLTSAAKRQAPSPQAPSIPKPYEPSRSRVDLNQVFLNGYKESSIVAKLADFGMTRDIYTNDYYRTNGKEMPVRWMPPECLDGVANIKSDVWSYGIFLWELFSMGQLPYQNLLSNREVIEFIKKRRHVKPQRQTLTSRKVPEYEGVEPEKEAAEEEEAYDLPPLQPPHDNTPYPIYSIMCSCWASIPEERPRFEEIANQLYWCLQRPEILDTSLPSFYEQHTPPINVTHQNFKPTYINHQTTIKNDDDGGDYLSASVLWRQ